MKTIYIHIGYGKTGTTSIQDMLFFNRHEFAKQGILYPTTGLRGTGHHNLAVLGKNELTNDFIDLKREIQNSNQHKIILSSEFFVFSKENYIKAMQETLIDYNVKVIFYIRDQLKLIESVYLQWQKVGDDYKKDIVLFFDHHKASFNFLNRIEPWGKYFGNENMIVEVFDQRLIGADVTKDFLTKVEIDKAQLELKNEYVSNESLLADFSNLITYIDALNPTLEQRNQIILELLNKSVSFKTCSKITLIDDEFRKVILNHYKESNLLFSNMYLSEEQKTVFLENTKEIFNYLN